MFSDFFDHVYELYLISYPICLFFCPDMWSLTYRSILVWLLASSLSVVDLFLQVAWVKVDSCLEINEWVLLLLYCLHVYTCGRCMMLSHSSYLSVLLSRSRCHNGYPVEVSAAMVPYLLACISVYNSCIVQLSYINHEYLYTACLERLSAWHGLGYILLV